MAKDTTKKNLKKRAVYVDEGLNKRVNEAVEKAYGEGRGAFQLFARRAFRNEAKRLLNANT